jgi:hypothetical protein|tara:strand:+ start:905 stop:1141 length:237 start_codon:yes stop_codon:yes gene_type:complete
MMGNKVTTRTLNPAAMVAVNECLPDYIRKGRFLQAVLGTDLPVEPREKLNHYGRGYRDAEVLENSRLVVKAVLETDWP